MGSLKKNWNYVLSALRRGDLLSIVIDENRLLLSDVVDTFINKKGKCEMS